MEEIWLTADITVNEVRIQLNLEDTNDWVSDEVVEAKISWSQYVVDNEISSETTTIKEYWAVLMTAVFETWKSFSFRVITATAETPPNFFLLSEWLNRNAILARALAAGGKGSLPDVPMTTVEVGVGTSLKGASF